MFKFNLKNVLLAILFTLISLVFTAHWFVKSDYWKNNYTLPDYYRYSIEADSELNITLLTNNLIDVTKLDIKKGDNNSSNKYKYRLSMMGAGIKDDVVWEFSVVPSKKTSYKVSTDFRSMRGWLPVSITSYKVNGEDVDVGKVLNLEPNSTYYFTVKAKQILKNTSLFKCINYFAFVITILLEFFAALFLISYGFKNICNKIVLYLKSNKIPPRIYISVFHGILFNIKLKNGDVS